VVRVEEDSFPEILHWVIIAQVRQDCSVSSGKVVGTAYSRVRAVSAQLSRRTAVRRYNYYNAFLIRSSTGCTGVK